MSVLACQFFFSYELVVYWKFEFSLISEILVPGTSI